MVLGASAGSKTGSENRLFEVRFLLFFGPHFDRFLAFWGGLVSKYFGDIFFAPTLNWKWWFCMCFDNLWSGHSRRSSFIKKLESHDSGVRQRIISPGVLWFMGDMTNGVRIPSEVLSFLEFAKSSLLKTVAVKYGRRNTKGLPGGAWTKRMLLGVANRGWKFH